MVGIIVCGHGNFASGLTSSVKLIAGEFDNYRYIDFTEDIHVDDLESIIKSKIDELDNCDSIIVLTDIVGGSPYKYGLKVSMEQSDIKVVSGTNLGMIIEVAMASRFIDSLDDLYEMALDVGKNQVVGFEFKVETSEEEFDF
ncbi:MAG: PTS galactosamine/N-acetylgalactosamine transporter subunit IIA [Peptostreptococcaceae bacterium]